MGRRGKYRQRVGIQIALLWLMTPRSFVKWLPIFRGNLLLLLKGLMIKTAEFSEMMVNIYKYT